MLRRVASHYIYWQKAYRLHYIELTDKGCIAGIYPLKNEIAGTAFYNGVLFPVPAVLNMEPAALLNFLIALQKENPEAGLFELPGFSAIINEANLTEPVVLYRLSGICLSPPKLCADNGCCNGYIERL